MKLASFLERLAAKKAAQQEEADAAAAPDGDDSAACSSAGGAAAAAAAADPDDAAADPADADDADDAGPSPAAIAAALAAGGPEPVPRDPVLASFDIDGVARRILESDAKNIIVMAGAGISVSAGIPDFRTPGTGLYDNLQKYDLPDPQAIFDIDYFRANPRPFYMLAKELFPGRFCPTPTHYFLRLLEEKGRLLRVFTQNIDSLETIAGLDPSRVIAAHGNFDSAKCIETGKTVDMAEVREAILTGEEGPRGWRALTERHGGLVKPDIVFFGESLPKRFFMRVRTDFPECDLLIVMGTSLAVHPFAALVDMVDETVPRLLINRERVGVYPPEMRRMLALMGRTDQGFDFDEETRWRDAAFLGDCDTGVRALAQALGWEADLDRIVTEGRAAFELHKPADTTTAEQQPSSDAAAGDAVGAAAGAMSGAASGADRAASAAETAAAMIATAAAAGGGAAGQPDLAGELAALSVDDSAATDNKTES